jgi:hypothetical protein
VAELGDIVASLEACQTKFVENLDNDVYTPTPLSHTTFVARSSGWPRPGRSPCVNGRTYWLNA